VVTGREQDWPGTLEIAAVDGTHVQEFGFAKPGPWNPLIQPGQEIAELPAASEGPTRASTLLLLVALLALVAGAVLIRCQDGPAPVNLDWQPREDPAGFPVGCEP
jgi:hypothetical protein